MLAKAVENGAEKTAKNGDGSIRVLLIGDVVGKSGCRALFSLASSLKKEYQADLLIANGENALEGSGLSPELVADFFKAGVDLITSGNHIWRHPAIFDLLDKEPRLLRPENYPRGVPGKGSARLNFKDCQLLVINLEGQLNNHSRLRCPFLTAKEILQKANPRPKIVIIDFHAEYPAEKEALAWFLDGEVSLLYGTHTHVPTADERILPNGTAYITDIGMTGPEESVIGMSVQVALKRALTQLPLKLEVEDKPAVLMGLVIEFDSHSGKALSLKRIKKQADF